MDKKFRLCSRCNVEATSNLCSSCKKIHLSEYRSKNRATILAQRCERRLVNKEKIKAACVKYYAENKEKHKACVSRCRKKNPEVYRIINQNKRAKRKKDNLVLSKGLAEKLFTLQKGRCPCCNQPLGDSYHLDHKMPISLGGKNEDSNIQLLRATCNQQKKNKHPVDFMQSRGFLL